MRFKLKRPAAMSTRGRLGFFERKGNKYKRDEPNEKKLRRWGRPGGFIAKLDATADASLRAAAPHSLDSLEALQAALLKVNQAYELVGVENARKGRLRVFTWQERRRPTRRRCPTLCCLVLPRTRASRSMPSSATAPATRCARRSRGSPT